MLLLPYLAGLLVAGFRWVAVPLLVAWLAGYLLSYYAFQALKSRRPARYAAQIRLYGVLAIGCATPVVIACPRVLAFAPAYAALLAVNGWHAWRRRERALLNDLASVVQSCLMVFVLAVVAGVSPGSVAGPFAVLLGYLLGTVLFVKTMIRERGNGRYLVFSRVYHVGAAGAAFLGGAVPGVVFLFLLGRAWLLPGRPLTPKRVGFVEIGASALVLLAAISSA